MKFPLIFTETSFMEAQKIGYVFLDISHGIQEIHIHVSGDDIIITTMTIIRDD